MLTGRPPFRGGSVLDTVLQVIEKEPDHPRAINPKANRDLAAIALKCLAKDPAGRYGSAAELADDLDRWLTGKATIARPPSMAGLAWRWLRRNTAAATTAVVVGIGWGLSGAMMIFGFSSVNSEPARMLADGTGPFNPLGTLFRACQVPALRIGMIVAGIFVTVTIGWILRAGMAGKKSIAMLGFAVIAGMLASATASLLLVPVTAVELHLDLHHLAEEVPVRVIPGPNGKMTVSHPDRDYLVRFLPPEDRDLDPSKGTWRLKEMLERAIVANRMYAAAIGSWLTQFMAMIFFLALGLTSTWAVDYLARSGRRLPARIGCYIELYLPITSLLLGLMGMLELGFIMGVLGQRFVGTPWVTWTLQLAAMLVWAVMANVGVRRRWRPWVRIGLYVAGFGLAIGLSLWHDSASRNEPTGPAQIVVPPPTPSPR